MLVLDELFELLKRELNPFLQEKGLPPLKRFSLQPLTSDILPSLNLALKETSLAEEFPSPKGKVWRGTFQISLLLKEGEENDQLLGSYIEAIREFLEGREIPSIFKGNLLKISPLPLKKPLHRGVSIEYEVLYLP